MDNKKIQEKFINLDNKLSLINENLINNNSSDFNVRNIIECWCEFGEAMNMLRQFYHENGFPQLNNGSDIVLGKLWMTDVLATSCRMKICDLEHILSFNDSEFLDVNVIGDLFFELTFSCCSGDYDVPINSNVATIKKELLCGLMETAHDYWQGKRIDSDYYENLELFEKLQDYYNLYKEYVGMQCKNYRCNDQGELVCVFEGAQFGEEIESVIEYIDKGYDRFKEKTKKLEKNRNV